MEVAIGLGLIIIFIVTVILIGKANESLGKSNTNSKFIEGVKTKTNYQLLLKRQCINIIWNGLPCIVDMDRNALWLDWDGTYAIGRGIIDVETLNQCELFTPLKEVSRSVVETEHADDKTTHKVSATLKSRMKKNYTITIDLSRYIGYEIQHQVNHDKTTTYTRVERPFSAAEGLDKSTYISELKQQKGIIIDQQDIYEITLKEYKRPVKIKTTTITYE